jgi:hypothetical protein
MQTYKNSYACRRHVEVCREKKRSAESDDGEESKYDEVFRPAFQQFGPHQMKKCSIFIKRKAYIEDAVLEGYLSIDVSKRPNANGKKSHSLK